MLTAQTTQNSRRNSKLARGTATAVNQAEPKAFLNRSNSSRAFPRAPLLEFAFSVAPALSIAIAIAIAVSIALFRSFNFAIFVAESFSQQGVVPCGRGGARSPGGNL